MRVGHIFIFWNIEREIHKIAFPLLCFDYKLPFNRHVFWRHFLPITPSSLYFISLLTPKNQTSPSLSLLLLLFLFPFLTNNHASNFICHFFLLNFRFLRIYISLSFRFLFFLFFLILFRQSKFEEYSFLPNRKVWVRLSTTNWCFLLFATSIPLWMSAAPNTFMTTFTATFILIR